METLDATSGAFHVKVTSQTNVYKCSETIHPLFATTTVDKVRRHKAWKLAGAQLGNKLEINL
jgi:hypothetical protein